MIIFLFPTWTIWPDSVINGISYIFSVVAKLNFLFPIDTCFICLAFFLDFIGYFITYLIVKKIFNYLRGAEGI